MIKAIVFDFAGVISPGALIDWVKRHTTNKNRVLDRLREKSYIWDLGQINELQFKHIISEITGVAEDKVWNIIWGKALVNKKLISLIKKLKKKFKIVLFSDNFAPYLQRQIDNLHIRNLFDEIIISSDYHKKKTDINFLRILLSILSMKKNEILLIDDSEINIKTARKFGILSHLFTSINEFESFLKANNINVK